MSAASVSRRRAPRGVLRRSPLPRAGAVVATLSAVALVLPGVGAAAAGPGPSAPSEDGAATVPFALVQDRDVDDRLPQPEDRYAVAGGCYTVELPGEGFLARDSSGPVVGDAATAEPFHFQATRLGHYLLATNEGPDTRYDGAWWDVRGYLAAASPARAVDRLKQAVGSGGGVSVAEEPSEDAEWELVAAGEDPDARADVTGGERPTYRLRLPHREAALGTAGGRVVLVAIGDAAPLRLHHHADTGACATWPEIETNVEGRPAPVRGSAAGRVRGFFEAHVHGMAYEFLGGELRCGQPWHPYGVEYALGDCHEDGQVLNAALEVAVAGQDPADPVTTYDPVGWPTFEYWPQYDTLTHEQFYWRWLERAYLGGLRLVTNLLVENTALCQVYPQKRNSCNEMDSVRLQAERLYELQDYIDAQRGGPGEGWLRIVTTPAEARRTINAGRLAVVMGIEVSVLFDCGEILDRPQCTEAQIDERLQEVLDMGVRQMELVNKFDNALSGVTGDGGSTGLVVNNGNRMVTGHYWDMQTCTEPDGHAHHEHDKTQPNAVDDAPDGDREEIDVLAGAVLGQFAPTRGYVAPTYPAGPHCNTRGLTELGAHLIMRMVEEGMIFDPDHMSALAQRQALDLLESHLEAPGTGKRGRGARRMPGLISSHSWANDAVYQRIYALDGVVAPRTAPADEFVERWIDHREWAAEHAPPGYDFGMGYGADTNGLGSQPGPRTDPARPVTYPEDGWEAPIGGVSIHRQTSGVRTYDVNTDGVAHYGLFADWFRELAIAADELAGEHGGGRAIIDDLLDGAETYLQMWERAVYGGNECVVDGSMPQLEDLHAAVGLNLEGFLRAVGQPVERDGSIYRYCVEGEGGVPATVEVGFTDGGTAVGEAEDGAGAVAEAAISLSRPG